MRAQPAMSVGGTIATCLHWQGAFDGNVSGTSLPELRHAGPALDPRGPVHFGTPRVPPTRDARVMYENPTPDRPLSVLWGLLVLAVGLSAQANTGPAWWSLVALAGVPAALLVRR